jgi:hypothetical protein
MNPLLSVRGAITAGFVLSVPMLLCMGSATHGLPF